MSWVSVSVTERKHECCLYTKYLNAAVTAGMRGVEKPSGLAVEGGTISFGLSQEEF